MTTPVRTELRSLLRLAAPLAAASAGHQLMGVVDTAIVGRLGPAELGAVGLANGLYFGISIVGTGVMMGLDPLIAQALGAGRHLDARRLLWQGVWLACIASALLSLPLAATPLLLEPFGIEAEVARLAGIYLWIRLPGLIPSLLFVAVRSYLQASGYTRPMLISVVAANLFNVVATMYLVFGGADLPAWTGPLRSMPGLGVAGAAIGTTLCTLLQLGIMSYAVGRLPVAGFERGMRRLRWPDVRTAAKVGTPIGLQMGAEVGVFALAGLLAGRLGTLDLAAHQISLSLASMSFTVAVGVGAAGAVRVGHAVGARDPVRTRIAGLISFVAGGGFMGLSAMVFWIIPGPLASLLTDKPEVISAAIPLLAVAAFFQISDGLQAVGAGVLRGAGDTRFSFVANLVGHYAVGLPVALLLGVVFDMGVVGIWWGLCAGLTAVAAVLLTRFLRMSAREIVPLESQPVVGGEG